MLNNYNALFELTSGAQSQFLQKFSFHTQLHFFDKAFVPSALHVFSQKHPAYNKYRKLNKEFILDLQPLLQKRVIAFVVNCHYDNQVHMICGYVFPTHPKGARVELYDPNGTQLQYQIDDDMYGYTLKNPNKLYNATFNFFYVNFKWANFSAYQSNNLIISTCGRSRGICAVWCLVHVLCTLWDLPLQAAYKTLRGDPRRVTKIISGFRNLERKTTIVARHSSLKLAKINETHQVNNIISVLT